MEGLVWNKYTKLLQLRKDKRNVTLVNRHYSFTLKHSRISLTPFHTLTATHMFLINRLCNCLISPSNAFSFSCKLGLLFNFEPTYLKIHEALSTVIFFKGILQFSEKWITVTKRIIENYIFLFKLFWIWISQYLLEC